MPKVTIPDKHYVGMIVRTGSSIPLGFITPWGEDAAALKRIDTVDSWCKASRTGPLPTTVIENTPMLGFKMSGDIRRGMQGGQDKWRIVDPRGFELEITSTNLSMLLADTTLEKGEILDKCVWAREGGQNLLLTVESEEYIEAVKMTEIANSTAAWKDVKLGNTVVLQNGISGRYLGKMHIIQDHYRDQSKPQDNLIESPGKIVHVIVCPTTSTSYPAGLTREMHLISNPKLSSVQSGNEITVADAEVIANESLRDPTCGICRNGYKDVLLMAANPIKDLSWRFSIIDAAPSDPWNRGYRDSVCFARLKDGTIGSIRQSGSDRMITLLDEQALSTGIYDNVVEQNTSFRHGYYSRTSGPSWNVVTKKISPSDVVSYHHLKIEVDTKAGNTVWNLI